MSSFEEIGNRDTAGRQALNTVFGDVMTGTRVPSILAQFQYPLESGEAAPDISNGGTIGYDESRLVLSTSTNTAGTAAIESVNTLQYRPGNESYMFFTAAFVNGGSDPDHYMYAGIYDYDGGNGNGFYIGYNGEDFVCGRRRDGVDTQVPIDVSATFSGFDPTLGNVYRITYGYLGYAPIRYEVQDPEGDWIEMHKVKYPNTSIETHIVNVYLPLRGEVGNTGSSVNHQLYAGSVQAGLVDGTSMNVAGRTFAYSEKNVSAAAGGYNLVAFQNKTTFAGKTNRVPVELTLVSCATDGNKSVDFELFKNPTLTAPTWTDFDATDSVMQYESNPTSTDDGDLRLPWNLAKVDSFFEPFQAQRFILRPGEIALMKATSQNNSEIDFGITWRELF